MARVGVFVCHCGENIGRTVDCARVALELGTAPGVVHSVDTTYMCSDPGQEMIRQAIAEHALDRVVVAANQIRPVNPGPIVRPTPPPVAPTHVFEGRI